MPKQYSGLGPTLLYPDSWNVNEENHDGQVTVLLESPSGSFISIASLPLDYDPDEMLEEAAAAMDSEYEDVEPEPFAVDLAGYHCAGLVQRFYYLDLLVASKLLTIKTDDQLFLVQIQGEDRDMDQQSIVFDAILTSLLQKGVRS